MKPIAEILLHDSDPKLFIAWELDTEIAGGKMIRARGRFYRTALPDREIWYPIVERAWPVGRVREIRYDVSANAPALAVSPEGARKASSDDAITSTAVPMLPSVPVQHPATDRAQS